MMPTNSRSESDPFCELACFGPALIIGAILLPVLWLAAAAATVAASCLLAALRLPGWCRGAVGRAQPVLRACFVAAGAVGWMFIASTPYRPVFIVFLLAGFNLEGNVKTKAAEAPVQVQCPDSGQEQVRPIVQDDEYRSKVKHEAERAQNLRAEKKTGRKGALFPRLAVLTSAVLAFFRANAVPLCPGLCPVGREHEIAENLESMFANRAVKPPFGSEEKGHQFLPFGCGVQSKLPAEYADCVLCQTLDRGRRAVEACVEAAGACSER